MTVGGLVLAAATFQPGGQTPQHDELLAETMVYLPGGQMLLVELRFQAVVAQVRRNAHEFDDATVPAMSSSGVTSTYIDRAGQSRPSDKVY